MYVYVYTQCCVVVSVVSLCVCAQLCAWLSAHPLAHSLVPASWASLLLHAVPPCPHRQWCSTLSIAVHAVLVVQYLYLLVSHSVCTSLSLLYLQYSTLQDVCQQVDLHNCCSLYLCRMYTMPTRAAPTMHGPAYVFVCACMCVLLLFILLLFIVHDDEHVSHHVLLMLLVIVCVLSQCLGLLLGPVLTGASLCLREARHTCEFFISQKTGGVFREKIFFLCANHYPLSKTPTKSISDFGRRQSPPHPRLSGKYKKRVPHPTPQWDKIWKTRFRQFALKNTWVNFHSV